MARVKGGVASQKRRTHLLKYTKGFRWGRKSKLRQAKEALFHAGHYAYRDRRNKKRDFRRLWLTKINIAAKNNGLTYNKLMAGLKKHNIQIDRKILSQLAENHPEIFKAIVESASSGASN